MAARLTRFPPDHPMSRFRRFLLVAVVAPGAAALRAAAGPAKRDC